MVSKSAAKGSAHPGAAAARAVHRPAVEVIDLTGDEHQDAAGLSSGRSAAQEAPGVSSPVPCASALAAPSRQPPARAGAPLPRWRSRLGVRPVAAFAVKARGAAGTFIRPRLASARGAVARTFTARNARRLGHATARNARLLRRAVSRGIRDYGPAVANATVATGYGAFYVSRAVWTLSSSALVLAGRATAALLDGIDRWQHGPGPLSVAVSPRQNKAPLRGPGGVAIPYCVDVTNERVGGAATWCQVMQEAVDGSCTAATLGHGRDQRAGGVRYSRLQVAQVLRVRHEAAWKMYTASRTALQVSTVDLPRGSAAHVAPPLKLPAALRRHASGGGSLQAAVNECYLWHGTKPEHVDSITRGGFNERLCSTGGYYGAGNYFADRCSKSDQYTTADRKGNYWLFLARVCLGHPLHLAVGKCLNNCRELQLVPGGKGGRRYDSVIGCPGAGGYTEYVTYKGVHAFPEFIILYKRV